MSNFFEFLKYGIICGTVLGLAFLTLLAMPRSKLRDFLMPFVAWSVSAASVAYALSPVDILPEMVLGPFGLFDDVAAVAVAIGSAMTAIKASKEAKQLR